MSGDIIIKYMSRAEAMAAAELERLCFSDPWSQALIEQEIDNPLTVCLYAHGPDGLLGYCMLLVIDGDAELLNIAVRQDKRRQGIGLSLLKTALERARQRGVKTVYLEVRKGGEAAISLYKSLGFERIGLRRNYYQKPAEDALLMKLDLEDLS